MATNEAGGREGRSVKAREHETYLAGLAVGGAIRGGEPEAANPGQMRGWRGGGGEEESLHGRATLYAAIWTVAVRCCRVGGGGPERGGDGGAAQRRQDGTGGTAPRCALLLL